jgi:hypothetical protein
MGLAQAIACHISQILHVVLLCQSDGPYERGN